MIDALDLLRLFGGFVYLVLGGDLLVRGALALSRRTSISPVIVGMTVVALGTSAPELMISVYATATGHSGVALGNVVGSNIANVLLVLGVPALISPVVASSRDFGGHTAFMVIVSIALVVMGYNGVISRPEGALLFLTLVGMLVYLSKTGAALPGEDSQDESEQFERVLGLPSRVSAAVGFILLGIMLLPLGADLTVEGASAIARALDVPEIVIGSTIVALGTSLPELMTTVIAAFHKSSGIALGNVLGSNVFNILLVGGVSAMVAPLPVPADFGSFDVWFMLGTAIALYAFVIFNRPIRGIAALAFVAGYIGYITYVI